MGFDSPTKIKVFQWIVVISPKSMMSFPPHKGKKSRTRKAVDVVDVVDVVDAKGSVWVT